MQHTAKHCNTLQRAATHCNTLQQTILVRWNWQGNPLRLVFRKAIYLALETLNPKSLLLFRKRVHSNMSQCVAMCRSVLQYVAVCCNMLQCVAMCRSVLHYVVVCCNMSQCVAICRSVLQCVAVCCNMSQCVAICCSVLQYVAVCCNMLQCITMYCSEVRESIMTVFRISRFSYDGLGVDECSYQYTFQSHQSLILNVLQKLSRYNPCLFRKFLIPQKLFILARIRAYSK